MSSTHNKFNSSARTGMPVFGTYNNSQASILLEKANPGLRRSTPDSEALASSDEELEPSRLRNINRQSMAQPARRTFSLADHPSIHRKPSITASGTYSPSNSNPVTPAADQNPWPAMSPSGTTWGGSTGYPWNGSIWTHESKREPPARLQEVHPSENDAGIPFSIPLQPTLKTYRSQSYSVGQLDQPASAHSVQPNATSAATESGRTRTAGQYPPLQRRTSRPGMMSTGDVGGLGRLREVDDDEETLDVTQRNVDQAREIERLEEENARLRAAQRERKMSSNSAMHPQPAFRNTQIRGAVPEESDLAVDDSEGPAQFRNGLSRRFSEQLTQYSDRQPSSPAEHRLSRWNTAGNYGRLADIPQSRRHSFAADAPTRPGSFSSHDEDDPSLYAHPIHGLTALDDPVYFKLDEKRRLEAEASVQQGLYSSPYGISGGIGPYGANQSFIIVNFKCCRSDIFYIQEGTGLHVQVGDLVVVDADRGTDLGAVQHTGVSLEEARRYKDYYAEEHYKLLMMFSQQTKNGGMNAVNPNGPPSRQSAVGGMGPQGHGHRDPHGDPKAKMVKRLAQAHEFQALKEKEGNEAKAKRVCSAKVIEHGLNMEILDAEFQMDQKKLTFYYFADEYINFNALVTDLFKIYKTRIWMSAINPASFQTPTSSLGLTPAYGNTGMGSPMSPMNEPNRRGQYGTPSNVVIGQYDDQRMEMRPRGAAPPFYPSYQAQTAAGQRLGGGMGGFPPAPMDPFASYPQQNFGMFGQPAPGFGMHHQEPRQGNHNQSPGPNFIGRFQGLSMGS